uniref:hypothetical protein n=1 Tax=Oculatella sp. LEGE 06141 TaxID=1828648 RepID=UPI0030D766BA
MGEGEDQDAAHDSEGRAMTEQGGGDNAPEEQFLAQGCNESQEHRGHDQRQEIATATFVE